MNHSSVLKTSKNISTQMFNWIAEIKEVNGKKIGDKAWEVRHRQYLWHGINYHGELLNYLGTVAHIPWKW